MLELDKLKFDEQGLIPAVVVDTSTKQVLMLAYMNAESLHISMEEGRTCFWSRSRQSLWRKGETSGNVQHIVSITADCDADTLLVEVRPDGPACHTGSASCFFQPVFDGETPKGFAYEDLMGLLRGRKASPKEGSYTTYLFEKGVDKILKKIGEETTEVILSAKDGDRANMVYEICDLMYHVMVLMVETGVELDEVKREMASRHIVEHKIKQEKMVE